MTDLELFFDMVNAHSDGCKMERLKDAVNTAESEIYFSRNKKRTALLRFVSEFVACVTIFAGFVGMYVFFYFIFK